MTLSNQQDNNANTPSRYRFGPGLLVAAAFIGPGTVTTASTAGAGFGFTLVWAIAFSVFATIVLQEMAARLGIITKQGLGESIRQTFEKPWAKWLSILLVVIAIGVGNAAYQAGNLTGAAVGVSELSTLSKSAAVMLIGDAALLLLLFGGFRFVQSTLIVLVLMMSVLFMTSALLVPPNWTAFLRDSFRPGIPDGSLLKIVALIGTTVVPYNLFLHATSASNNWANCEDPKKALRHARLDSFFSIGLGGMVTLAIMSTAVVAFYGQANELTKLGDVAEQLKPAAGDWAHVCFAIGLAAAGITSAITAPLAAGFAVAGCLGWSTDLTSTRCKFVVIGVLIFGRLVAVMLNRSPAEMIQLAQAANGLLLPLVALFLLIVVNQKKLLGEFKNRWLGNGFGAIVILFTATLGGWKVIDAIRKAFFD